jgi:hypothetical protein
VDALTPRRVGKEITSEYFSDSSVVLDYTRTPTSSTSDWIRSSLSPTTTWAPTLRSRYQVLLLAWTSSLLHLVDSSTGSTRSPWI